MVSKQLRLWMFETEGETLTKVRCKSSWGPSVPPSGLWSPFCKQQGVVRSYREDHGGMSTLFFYLENSLWQLMLNIIARAEASEGRLIRRLILPWEKLWGQHCSWESIDIKGVREEKHQWKLKSSEKTPPQTMEVAVLTSYWALTLCEVW